MCARKPDLRPLDTGLIVLITLAAALGHFGVNVQLPGIVRTAEEFGASVGFVQIGFAIYFTAFACSQLVFGTLSDRVGRRPPLLVGLAVFGFGVQFLGWSV